MKNPYTAEGAEDMISPCLIYYEDGIRKNIEKAIQIAGSVERLWPHVKSHKSNEMVKLQLEYGICKFKTATIAEAEMAAMAGAKQVILAYPLIGPNMARFVHLSKAYPDTIFYGVEDDLGQLEKLSEVCKELDFEMPVLIDVNMGMNRTGAAINRVSFYFLLFTCYFFISGLQVCCPVSDSARWIHIHRSEVFIAMTVTIMTVSFQSVTRKYLRQIDR